DAEAAGGVVAARLAQPGGRQRLLEAQGPAVDRPGGGGAGRRAVLDDQGPGPVGADAREAGQRLTRGALRGERGEERGAAALDRGARLVVEDGVREVGGVDAAAHAAEQRDRDLAGLPYVVIQGRRQVGVFRVAEVDLNPQAADARGGGVALHDEVVGHGDRRRHLARPGRAGGGDRLRQVGRRVVDGRRRPVLALAAERVEAR